MRKQKPNTNFSDHIFRLRNLLYAITLNVNLGKTKEERFKTIAQYQAQANVPKNQWLC